jgi:hypothetical protein
MGRIDHWNGPWERTVCEPKVRPVIRNLRIISASVRNFVRDVFRPVQPAKRPIQ